MENNEVTIAEKLDLKKIIAPIIGNRRRFFLLRVADIGVDEALSICKVKKSTYASWMQDEVFKEINSHRTELSITHKNEAIQLLRRENQLAAALLEGEIIDKIRKEVETDTYILSKTQIAREVYVRVMGDLDPVPPEIKNLTWDQRIQSVFNQLPQQPRLTTPEPVREVIDAEATVCQADSGQTLQHTEGGTIQEGEQPGKQTDEISKD
jgi:hypothetical protein